MSAYDNEYDDSSAYDSGGNMEPLKEKIVKDKQKLTSKVPYGRKRSCWKKSYNPESPSVTKSVSVAGVITCAICGIQRFYKFMKQAKKFGLHSCEPCRKFISSMILNVKNNEQLLFSCIRKGPQNCLLTESLPIPNGTPRTKKDALSNMRCRACWLSLCLEKYKMPLGLRNSLAQFITEDDRPTFSMNDEDDLFGEVDFSQLTKQRSQNSFGDKSCMKIVCENFLKSSGLYNTVEDSKNKIVILRIKC